MKVSEDKEFLLEIPAKARALFVFAHGAGAGMRHRTMTAIAEALHAHRIGTYRFQFPYMARGSKRPDKPDVAVAAIASAVLAAGKAAPKLPLLAGGKSFGSRMTTTAAAEGVIPTVKGILCFGFPLHPAKKPGIARAAHLAKVRIPTLMLQGTRDELSELTLLRPIIAAHAKVLKLHIVEGADHGFAVLKSSGRSEADVLAELGAAAGAFVTSL